MKIVLFSSQLFVICLFVFSNSLRIEAQEIVLSNATKADPDKLAAMQLGEEFQKKSLAMMSHGKYDSSRFFIEEAMRKFLIAGDSGNIAKCNNIMGGIIRHAGDFRASIPYHLNALKIYRQMNDSSGLMKTHNLIGIDYKELTEYDSAIVYYFRSLRFADYIKDTTCMRIAMMNAAQVYIDLNEYTLAKHYLGKCMKLLVHGRDDEHFAMILNKLGAIEMNQDNLDTALTFLERSLKIYSQLGSFNSVGVVRTNIGVVYKKKGDFELALYNFELAKNYLEKFNHKLGELRARMNIGLIYMDLKDYRTAIQHYDTCYRIGRKLQARSELEIIYFNLFTIYKAINNNEKALEYHLKYTAIKDSIFDLDKATTIANLELKYEQEKYQSEILKLNNANLQKDLDLKKASIRKNIYLTSIVIVLMLTLFILLFYKQRIKRNRILAEQKLKNAEEERKHASAKALLEGQEEERFRISRELHDGVGVLLSTASLYISNLEEDGMGHGELVAKTQKIVSEANADVRKISRNLMPSVLTVHGLDDAFADLIENFDYLPGKKGEFTVLGTSKKFSKAKEIMIYRLVQEFVSNTIKHAEANSINLLLNYRSDRLIITYCDDGKGFDFNKKLLNKSVGLKSIQSRVDVLNGSLNFESTISDGSCFTVSIPFEKS